MKTILITAYAVNPYKGSEDAMGWNMLLQAARYNKIIAVTRKNNRKDIEKYYDEHIADSDTLSQLSFIYFDWPKWMIFWKKGPMLSMIYYYFWQISLVTWLMSRNLKIDIAHNLNFHNDWTPSFLWLLGKPFVWGHIGHHPKIERRFLLPVYGKKEYMKDRLMWLVKNLFWKLDPFLFITKKTASKIICMNSSVAEKISLSKNYIVHPSVAADKREKETFAKDKFQVLSVGRFVPLKGFDLTIKSFAAFYHGLPDCKKNNVSLCLVGTGPFKDKMLQWIADEKISHVTSVIEWMPRHQLDSLYKGSSVFLFPSHEGAGMVVPEAMSFQLPVLCLKNCGPGEFLHPESQLAVIPSTYDETIANLASKLSSLAYFPAFIARESALSALRFDELFHWDVRGEMLKKIYDEILINSTETVFSENNKITYAKATNYSRSSA
jgi:glycosyltransferase involved in cell wall biosynthesis